MNRHAPLRASLAIMIAAVTLSLVAGCSPATERDTVDVTPPRRLVVITPHNEDIRNAFAAGFSDWCAANNRRFVQIDWVIRGTPQCVDYIQRAFQTGNSESVRLVPEIMFGGGLADHLVIAERGESLPIDLEDALEGIPSEVNGLPTRDADGRWFSTGLSSFGILYNAARCAAWEIEPPTTWADLADPRFRGWLAVADPAASGSHRQAMAFVVQSKGWAEGWSTLIRILGNTRAVVSRSGAVLDQVACGVSLAGFAVNFDGLARVDASAGRLVYVNPPNATAVTPDCTSVLKTATDIEAATDFMRYCLSEAGQVIWSVKAEHHGGGATLYHYPIRLDIYEKHGGELAVPENPFEKDFGLRVNPRRGRDRSAAITLLVRSATGDNHVLLQRAWQAVVNGGMDAASLSALCAPPIGEADALNLGAQYRQSDAPGKRRMEEKYAAQFAHSFERALELATK